jgi:PPOX class probable F420-dependent enzyme
MVEFPESHRDLLQSQVAILATQGADGYPQVTALWFVYEDSEIRFSLNNTRQKTKNMQRQAECTLLLIDPASPYRTLEIRGKVEVVPDEGGAFVEAVQHKYGVDVRQNDRPGDQRMAVTLHPVKVNKWG